MFERAGAFVGGLLLAPEDHATRPAGSNLMTMSEPLSVTQMLSCWSMRTACAKDHA